MWSQLALLISTAALCSRHGGVVHGQRGCIGLCMVAGGTPPLLDSSGPANGAQS